MSDDQRNAEPASETQETDAQPDTQATAQNDAPTDSASDSPAARIAELERLLTAERDAATDYMQRWQRAMADFSNFKRRAQQEQNQREQILGAQALMPVLHALDSFERAFASLPDSLRGYSWIEGIALVEAQLRRALEMAGITETPAEPGQPFDPARHQAIGEVASGQYPAGTVAALVQRGYQVASLLMRPALVQVARAPESQKPEETGEPKESTTAKTQSEGERSEPSDETQPSGPAP